MPAVPVPLLVLLLQAAPPPAVPPLGFAEALGRARAGNESILAARSEEAQRREERRAARGLYWPSVSFDPLYTHLGDEILLDLDPIRDVILTLHPQVPSRLVPPFEETLFKQDMLRLPLTARWPLFTGRPTTWFRAWRSAPMLQRYSNMITPRASRW